MKTRLGVFYIRTAYAAVENGFWWAKKGNNHGSESSRR